MTRQVNYREIQCGTCTKTFKPESSRQRYCSDVCKSQRLGKARCKVCNTEFYIKTHTSGNYCSPECWYKSGDAKVLPVLQCEHCDKDFHSTHKTQKYCGVECRNLGMRKPRVENCLACGKFIPYAPFKKQTKYCSRSCAMTTVVRRNEKRNQPIGTKRISPLGYMVVKVAKGKGGWKQEHRVIMEQVIGRKLEKHERVHHKNGIRDDNHPENLELWTVGHKDPPGIRVSDKPPHCPTCTCNLH